ncbi:DUF397 domain-containing protein [Actinokineospora globicatena]|uniref:DUF397 domain-containing protein n=1 Tax=Actinokineospora globicatena TaxID=103729 RepID=UPI003D7FFAC6
MKSSSSDLNENCVEVSHDLELARIRSSHNRLGGVITLSGSGWSALVDFAAVRKSRNPGPGSQS